MAEPLLSKATQIESFQFQNEEDKKLWQEVCEDVKDMDDYAQPARDIGREVIQGYMAVALDAKQGGNRSRLFPPVLHGIIYSSLSMQAANLPNVKYKHRKASSEAQMRFLNAALKHSEQGDGNLRPPSLHLWFNQNFDKELLGVGARYQSYILQTRKVHVRNDQGQWVEKTMIVHDDVWDENIDFFHFGVSRDMLPGMFGGRACYFDKFFSRDAFNERFDTPFYRDIDKVPYDEWYSGDSDYSWDVPKGFVRVRYYYDLYKDLFYVLANGIPIRKDYILDYGDPNRPKKFLPISTIHGDIGYEMQEPSVPTITQEGRSYSNVSTSASTAKTFWTPGKGYLTKGLIGLKRALWRAAADNVKASSVHFLLAKSTGVFDQIRTSDLYGIVPIKGDEGSFDVQSLTEGSTFLQKWMETDENIEGMVSSILGDDWRRAATQMTNQQATVAAIQQQVQRLRAAQNQKYNDTGPITRHYMIRLNLIQQYYVEPTEVPIEGQIPEGTEEEDIVRNADGQPVGIKKYKEIPIDHDVVEIKKDGKFRLVTPDHPDAKGKSAERVFRARKDHLHTEEEPEVYIEAGSTFAEMRALEASIFNESLMSLSPFLQMVYPDEAGVAKPLIPKEGAQYVLEKFAEVREWDKDKLLGKKNEEDGDEEPLPAFSGPPPKVSQMPTQMPPQPQAPQGGMNPVQAQASQLGSSVTI